MKVLAYVALLSTSTCSAAKLSTLAVEEVGDSRWEALPKEFLDGVKFHIKHAITERVMYVTDDQRKVEGKDFRPIQIRTPKNDKAELFMYNRELDRI